MATLRHLGFVKHILDDPQRVFGGLYHWAKFGWNCQTGFDNMEVWTFARLAKKRLFPSQMSIFGALDSKNKVQYQRVRQKTHLICTETRYMTFRSSKSVKRLLRYSDYYFFYQDGGRLPSWICGTYFGTSHKDYLEVSIIVPNFVRITVVSFIVQKFEYFASLAWKCLFQPPKRGFVGHLTPKMGCNIKQIERKVS